ncbi:MAG: hypothetical protein IPP74_04635 [Alphaproteobacteria bacterium]|nr:hypothetical protein [Alphaproteobacteria bacterium]
MSKDASSSLSSVKALIASFNSAPMVAVPAGARNPGGKLGVSPTSIATPVTQEQQPFVKSLRDILTGIIENGSVSDSDKHLLEKTLENPDKLLIQSSITFLIRQNLDVANELSSMIIHRSNNAPNSYLPFASTELRWGAVEILLRQGGAIAPEQFPILFDDILSKIKSHPITSPNFEIMRSVIKALINQCDDINQSYSHEGISFETIAFSLMMECTNKVYGRYCIAILEDILDSGKVNPTLCQTSQTGTYSYLEWAVNLSALPVVECLIQKGFTHTNQCINQLVEIALLSPSIDILKTLLVAKNLKLDLNYLNEHGLRPIHVAVIGEDLNKLKALVEAGADLSLCDSWNESVLLKAHLLKKPAFITYIKNQYQQILPNPQELISAINNEDVDFLATFSDQALRIALDKEGNQAIHLAAKADKISILKALVDRKAIINAVNFNRKDVLEFAGKKVDEYFNAMHHNIVQQLKTEENGIAELGFDGSIKSGRLPMIFASNQDDKLTIASDISILYSEIEKLRPRLHALTLLGELNFAQALICHGSNVSTLSPILGNAYGVYPTRRAPQWIKLGGVSYNMNLTISFESEFYVSNKKIISGMVHEGGHLLDCFYAQYCGNQHVELDFHATKNAVTEWLETNQNAITDQQKEIIESVIDCVIGKSSFGKDFSLGTRYDDEIDMKKELFVRIHEAVTQQRTDQHLQSIPPLWDIFQDIVKQETLLVKHLMAHQLIRDWGLMETDYANMRELADSIITVTEEQGIEIFDISQPTPPTPLAERLSPQLSADMYQNLLPIQNNFVRLVPSAYPLEDLEGRFLSLSHDNQKDFLIQLCKTPHGIEILSQILPNIPDVLILLDRLAAEESNNYGLPFLQEQVSPCLFVSTIVSNSKISTAQKIKLLEMLEARGINLSQKYKHNNGTESSMLHYALIHHLDLVNFFIPKQIPISLNVLLILLAGMNEVQASTIIDQMIEFNYGNFIEIDILVNDGLATSKMDLLLANHPQIISLFDAMKKRDNRLIVPCIEGQLDKKHPPFTASIALDKKVIQEETFTNGVSSTDNNSPRKFSPHTTSFADKFKVDLGDTYANKEKDRRDQRKKERSDSDEGMPRSPKHCCIMM